MEVGADVLLRALAITLVTYNHAHPESDFAMGWGGGMTFLMMLSGYNFAKYGMDGARPEQARAALVRLGTRILLPSFIAVIAFFILLQRFDWQELLFYRNWFTTERIAKFPTWYPQVMVQMFAGIALLFSLPGIGAALFKHPVRAAFAVFAVAASIRLTFPLWWDTAPLHHNLPHLFLWNFTLGWVVYFASTRLARPWGTLLACACAIAGAFIAWRIDKLDFWCLGIGTALLVLPLRVRLWKPVARAVFITSQATFAIFLLHRFVYEVYERLPLPQNADAEWLVGLFGSIALWIAGVVPVRAYRALRRRPARRPAVELPMLQPGVV